MWLLFAVLFLGVGSVDAESPKFRSNAEMCQCRVYPYMVAKTVILNGVVRMDDKIHGLGM